MLYGDNIIKEVTIPPRLLHVLVDFVNTYVLHIRNNLKRIVGGGPVHFLFKLLSHGK